MSRRHSGSVVGMVIAAMALAVCLAGESAAQDEVCVGDCDTNRQVSVGELIRGVNIALGALPASSCTAFDRNMNQAVTITELIAGVNSALQGCFPPVVFRGLCLRPGPSGLVPCAAGSTVRLSVCLDRSRCLFDPTARRLLQSASAGGDGRFSLFVTDEAVLNGLLLLESDVAAGVAYRTLAFGPASAGSVLENLELDPRSEAGVRLINSNGLHLFSDLSIDELIALVRAALANLAFAGLAPGAAADLAESSAGQDGSVQNAIDARRFTPVPTHTATATATATLTPSVTATPTATATATLTPTATASYSVTPSATATASASATPTITLTPTPTSSPTATLPPLNLAIEVNPDPVRPGETAEVSFTVTNTGGSNLGPISLETVLPMNIQPFLDNLPSGTGRCGPGQIQMCSPGGTLIWHFIGTLAPGEGITHRVPMIIAPGTPNGTLIELSGTAGAPGQEQVSAYTAVVQSGGSFPYDLALTQDHEPVAPGALLTYTVAYGFRAVVGQAQTILRLRPPAGTSIVAASDGGAPIAGGEVEWALGTLTPGDGGIRRLTVQVDEVLHEGELLEAQATIRRSDDSGVKRANAVSRVRAPAPLSLAIEANPDPARPGDSVDVAILVTNTSDAAATATLDLVVPDLIDPFLDIIATGGATCGPFSLGNSCERGARARWTLTVPARDSAMVRLSPIVGTATPSGSVIHLQARLANPQNSYVASARGALHVDAGTIWDLFVDEDRDPVGPAETYTYRLTARHRPSDPDPADGILTLVLPDGVSVVAVSDDAVEENGSLRWVLGPLASGAGLAREVVVQVDNDIAAPARLVAEATLHDPANLPDAKRSRTMTRAVLGSPIALSLAVVPDPARPGEMLETELTVTNTGVAPLNGIRLEARMPEGVDPFFTSLSAGAACSAITLQCAPREVARWNTPPLPGGESLTVRVPPLVSPATPDGTPLRLHASAIDVSGGRSAVLSRTVVVDSQAPFDLAVNESADPALPGQPLTYTVRFGRTAAGTVDAAVLRLDLPAGVFVVDAGDDGEVVDDNSVEWALGELAPGEVGSRQVEAVVDTLLNGTPLRGRAKIYDEGDPASEKRAEVVTAVGTSPLVFSLTAGPEPVQPGGVVTVALSVTNNGAAAVNNLVVEGIVPQEVNAFLDSATTGGGRCGAFTFNSCEPRQRVIFPIPTVAAGATVSVTMPPTIRGSLPAGSVVRFVGWLQPDIGAPPILATAAVTVGDAM